MVVSKAAKKFNVSSREICKILNLKGFLNADRPSYFLSELEFSILESEFYNVANQQLNKNQEVLYIESIIQKKTEFASNIEIVEKINESSFKLSSRAVNILKYQIIPFLTVNNFKSKELCNLKFYTKLRNCGAKTSIELVDFFNEIIMGDFQVFDMNRANQVENLDQTVKLNSEIIIELIKLHKNILSVRSQNGIDFIIKSILDNPKNIFEYLIPEKVAKRIQNIGAKSSLEISSFLEKILILLDREKIDNLSEHVKIQTLFVDLGINQKKLDNYKNEIPTYFEIFELFIKAKKLRLDIIEDYLKGNNYTSISNKIGLSSERVRQVVYKFDEELTFYTKSFNDIISRSEFDFSNFITEGEKIGSEKIVKKYDIKLHPKIIGKLLNPKVFIIKAKRNLDEEGKLNNYFDIKLLIQKILELNKKVEDDFYLPLNGFIFNYLREKEYTKQIDKFYNEIQDLIFEKTGIITNNEGALVFLKNTKPKKYDVIKELLEKTCRPMHLDEISEIIGLKKENIRGTLLKGRHLFVNTASSTYGLKKWEDEGKIKGGTIIEIIYQFLNSKPEPSHIYQIYKYVSQFRDTTERSLEGLIKSDTQNRFLKLGASFYGIKGVHDDYEYEVFRPLPGSWHLFLYKNYLGLSVNLDQFIANEQRKFNMHTFVIKANVEKRIDLGDIKIDNKGMLIFKK
ncbi:MAG: hypothetical protein H6567_12430 [Lewinellaceae bacterium]|nr:hypothetical protein [Lewinellaceae bacterium]